MREYGIFGSHSGVLSVTDGEYVLMIAPRKGVPVYNYTLVVTHMRSRMTPDELKNAELVGPFSFTKGCKVLKFPAPMKTMAKDLPEGEELLFNVLDDPRQQSAVQDEEITGRLKKAAYALLKENDAPDEIYERYGLSL